MKTNPFKYQTVEWLKRKRAEHRLNQTKFWARVGVSQSTASRYESGRTIPRSVSMLLALAYGTPFQRNAVQSILVDVKAEPENHMLVEVDIGRRLQDTT